MQANNGIIGTSKKMSSPVDEILLLSKMDSRMDVMETEILDLKEFRHNLRAKGKCGNFGIGLALTKEIIDRHKGHIRVQSEPGCTEFWVELPGGKEK